MTPACLELIRGIISTTELYRDCYVSEVKMHTAMNAKYPESYMPIPPDRANKIATYNEVLERLRTLIPSLTIVGLTTQHTI